MMFKIVSSSLGILIFFLFLFTIVTPNSKINFETFKNKFIKNTSLKKLENYMKKIQLKKLGIDESNSIFIDLNDKDRLILNNITENDLNFDDSKDYDQFKARLFSFFYKNKNKNDEKVYKPLGINLDEEKVPSWKIFLVLMTDNSNKHKLLKVCIREDCPQENFALVLNFDNSCESLISKINTLKTTGTTDKLHKMQTKILNSQIRNKLSKNKNILSNKLKQTLQTSQPSFIEKSSKTITEHKEEKTFSIDTLAHKFSVEELAKIKFLIKFAKTNNILDDIYNKKGELKLSDLFQPTVQPNIGNPVFPTIGPVVPIIGSQLVTGITPPVVPTIVSKLIPGLTPPVVPTIGSQLLPRLTPPVVPTIGSQLVPGLTPPVVPTVGSQLVPGLSPVPTIRSKINSAIDINSYSNSTIKNEKNEHINELKRLKSTVESHQKHFENSFKELNYSMRNIKDMLIFVKELSGEFHKSMLVFGNTLSSINQKVNKLELNTINKALEKNKTTLNIITNKSFEVKLAKSINFTNFTDSTNNNTSSKPINNSATPNINNNISNIYSNIPKQENNNIPTPVKEYKSKITAVKNNEKEINILMKMKSSNLRNKKKEVKSPFLASNYFASMEDDDVLEPLISSRKYKNTDDQKENDKKFQNDFINP